jgi:hypothetical protein
MNFVITLILFLISSHAYSQTWQSDFITTGQNENERFGAKLLLIDDINGDGNNDFVATSPSDSETFHRKGSINIISGVDGTLIAKASGDDFGQQIGQQVTYLGRHGDNLYKFAASSPFANTSSGPYSGLVRIYAYNPADETISLWQELNGDNTGAMFGCSLAAFDDDNDGDKDLAIGSLGYSTFDGCVEVLHINSTEASFATIYEGPLASKELFGFTLQPIEINNIDCLLIGSPFRNANRSGGVSILKPNKEISNFSNPISGVNNAYLGYVIASGQDITGDSVQDTASSSPDTNTVVLWENISAPGHVITGSADSEFGTSIAMVPDNNFNNVSDLLIGSPGNGEALLYDVSVDPAVLISTFNGPTGYGSSVAHAGSQPGGSNGTSLSPILIGNPMSSNKTGEVESLSQEFDPITITCPSDFEWYQTITISVNGLGSAASNGTLYWYVGTSSTSSTSPEGFNLNIGGNVQLINSFQNPGNTAQQTWEIPDIFADNTELYFQLVEDRNGFSLASDVANGTVIEPTPFILTSSGNNAGGLMFLSITGGTPGGLVEFYGGLNPAGDPVDLGMMINSGTPTAGGALTVAQNVPGSFAGRTAYLQALDATDISNLKRSNTISVSFN